MGLQRRKYSAEFKQEAVALVQRSGQSANHVAKELGVNQTALSRWLREATNPASSPNGFRAAEALKALCREVERLRMERDTTVTERIDQAESLRINGIVDRDSSTRNHRKI